MGSDNNNYWDCRGVLFDLDGVLIDSTPCVERVWRAWAVEHGLNPDEVVHIAHGRRSIETIGMVAPQLNAEKENAEVERRELADTEGLVVIEGAKELLASLPPESWTIVTSGTRPLATLRLQVAGLPVPKKMVTADDVELGKPNPEPYLKGAAALGYPPGDCVVVEDAPAGLRAARAAGMRCFGIQRTYSAAELTQATALLRNLRQIKVIRERGSGVRLEW
jgi:mannitol-1-/sugar-/sorbitol-6-phosphatase